MKFKAFSILFLLCLLFHNSAHARHALWVWDMADDIVLNEKDRMDFWSFIEAPHAKTELNVSIIYLSTGKNLLNEYPKKISEFLADAHSRGLTVEYLTGDPLWALTDTDPFTGEAYNQPSLDELNDLLAYNISVPENERFDGYQQDTEPYILERQSGYPLSWSIDTEKEKIWDQFVANTQLWKSIIDNHNAQTGDDLIMGSAIPLWWDPEAGTDVNHQTIQDIVDYIVVMNYDTRIDSENPETGIARGVLSEIKHAENKRYDNSVYIGMETLELTYKENLPETFFEQLYTASASYFYGDNEGLLGIDGLADDSIFLETFLSDSSAYGSNAFHYYEDTKNGDSAFRALGYENSKHAPAVWVVSPSYTEILCGLETIRYIVYDPDGDPLDVSFKYSRNGGEDWSEITTLTVTRRTDEIIYYTLSWDVSALLNGDNYLIKVTATETTTEEQLSGYDQSEYIFSIVDSKTDIQNPAPVAPSSINWSYDKPNEVNVWWDESSDNNKIAGYYYSYIPNNPDMGSFSRGNRVRFDVPLVDSMFYIWAVDNSGNLSAATSCTIEAIEDIDQDGIVNDDSNEVDRDGDGVRDTDEIIEGTAPDDPLDFSASRVIGHWMFEGNLTNSVSGGPNINDEVSSGGTIGYASSILLNSQALEIGGTHPVRLPLESNPTAFDSDTFALTIELWIKPDLNSRSELSFIPLACFGDLDAGLTLLLKNNSDLLSLRRYTSASNGAYASINAQNNDLFDGEWHHVACSYNGYNGMLKLYIDGKLAGSGQKTPGPLKNTRKLRFFDGRSNYDNRNSTEEISNILIPNSGQFENNLFDFLDDVDESKIRYLGLVDNIKVTKAAVPIELLGYYQDQSEDYNTWKEDAFGFNSSNSEISGSHIDYSKDGISNFLAYASGLDPLVNNSAIFMNSPIVETRGGQHYLSLRYLESKIATSRFQVQTSASLDSSDWFDQADVASYLDGEFENSWIRKVSVPFDAESKRLFMRLSVNADTGL